MLEKLKEITIGIVITLFFLFFFKTFCLVWEKRQKQSRWCGFGTLQVGNKMVSCEPNHNPVAFDEQEPWKLCPGAAGVRQRALQNTPEHTLSSGTETPVVFNVSPFLSPVWNFYSAVCRSSLGHGGFFFVCEVVKRNIRLTCNLSDCVVLVKSYIYFIYNPMYIYISVKK